uniref:Uncharacterized protein n=1 Tax=Lepeophtheirus salmonis TaxID=72036 RepID=A0A0K2U192_LEPSM
MRQLTHEAGVSRENMHMTVSSTKGKVSQYGQNGQEPHSGEGASEVPQFFFERFNHLD